jgi:hypothetical protein
MGSPCHPWPAHRSRVAADELEEALSRLDERTARTRAWARKAFSHYGGLPSYREMLAREGAQDVSDLVIAGGESEVADSIAELASAGVTDFSASEVGRDQPEHERTRALLRSLQAAELANG